MEVLSFCFMRRDTVPAGNCVDVVDVGIWFIIRMLIFSPKSSGAPVPDSGVAHDTVNI